MELLHIQQATSWTCSEVTMTMVSLQEASRVALDMDFLAPSIAPDLSPLDFFLWGYIKDQVYSDQPKTIEELKTAITSVIRSIPTD